MVVDIEADNDPKSLSVSVLHSREMFLPYT